MTGRTYSREVWLDARDQWAEGGFGSEWRPWRELAAASGIIFPPTGTAADTIDAPEPSQRAIVYRAMTDTPALLRRSIAGAGSWSAVVGRVLRGLAAMRDTADLAERDNIWVRGDEPSPTDATLALRAIIQRIADS
jgi:hypothetical protein